MMCGQMKVLSLKKISGRFLQYVPALQSVLDRASTRRAYVNQIPVSAGRPRSHVVAALAAAATDVEDLGSHCRTFSSRLIFL